MFLVQKWRAILRMSWKFGDCRTETKKVSQSFHIVSTSPSLLISCSLVNRRLARLETKGKETTWTSGQFSVGDLYGSERRQSASATRPLRRCCQWRGSSMDGRSTVREKFTPCRAPASTACGRPWKASLWSPVRARRAANTTVTHTQSSDLDFSSLLLSLPIFLSVGLWIPTSVPHYTFTSSSLLLLPHSVLLSFQSSFKETVPKSVMSQGTMTSSYQSFTIFLTLVF